MNDTPHVPALQVRVAQALSAPGQSLPETHCTQEPAPSHNFAVPWEQGARGGAALPEQAFAWHVSFSVHSLPSLQAALSTPHDVQVTCSESVAGHPETPVLPSDAATLRSSVPAAVHS